MSSIARRLDAGAESFDAAVSANGQVGLYAEATLATVQVNIGLRCNLTCGHCHVNSSPRRTEEMSWETMEAVISLATRLGARTIDITGGAPEMHPRFRNFVSAARAQDFSVIVRTNLTVLLLPEYEDLPEFFKLNDVNLVASLPCYLEENVDGQRGENVYNDSIEAIRRLNAIGYGVDSRHPLTLIYNPIGPALPPDQGSLEADYRRELRARFGIEFTRLHTITNVPIGRFVAALRRAKQAETYERLLAGAFNSSTVPRLMCRHQISVAWDGTLYDCDFNLALRLPVRERNNVLTVNADTLKGRRIVTGAHCYACTAGAGSSCGGALV